MNLRPFAPDDATAVSILLNTAFDSPSEAQLVASLRAAGDMALELVAEDDTSIYGYIAFCRLREPEGWWSLSPVAGSSSAGTTEV